MKSYLDFSGYGRKEKKMHKCKVVFCGLKFALRSLSKQPRDVICENFAFKTSFVCMIFCSFHFPSSPELLCDIYSVINLCDICVFFYKSIILSKNEKLEYLTFAPKPNMVLDVSLYSSKEITDKVQDFEAFKLLN